MRLWQWNGNQRRNSINLESSTGFWMSATLPQPDYGVNSFHKVKLLGTPS